MTVEIVTFGCRLNAGEADDIRAAAGEAGITDTVVVNTCAVTGEAVAQARQRIRRLRRERPQARIVVTGCAAQTLGRDFAAMAEVDRVLGNADKISPRAWRALHEAAPSKLAVSDIMQARVMAPPRAAPALRQPRAFVQVQNGCDHRCTFCIIPFGRGPSRSLDPADAVAQVRAAVTAGHAEVVLTGVDLTSYGGDLADQPGLGALARRILREVPELKRLRLSSIDSVEVDRDLLDLVATEPRLMPHLHLSLQAGDDLILKRMKRRHSHAGAVALCAQLRRLRPDLVLGADLIAGFPTETEEMFARSLDLVAACGLTLLHVFPFSPRPGTPAARMPQLAPDVIRARAARLRAHGEAALARRLDAETGARREVLVESARQGRTEHFLPVLLDGGEAGAVQAMTVTGHDGARLSAVRHAA
jgi:threonylcarbamoyladenosine tRNA methylthiotransferase MtaB